VTDLHESGSPHADRLTRAMAAWYAFCERRRVWLVILLIVSGVLLAAASTKIRWQNNVLLFFPQSSPEMKSLRAASRYPSITNHLYVDLHCSMRFRHQLPAAARMLAADMRKTHDFHSVWEGVSPKALTQSGRILNAELPGLLDKKSFKILQSHLHRRWLGRHFAALQADIEAPGGVLQLAGKLHDPLAARSLLHRQMRSNLPEHMAIGRVMMDRGQLSADHGTHIMLMATPRFAPAQTRRSTLMLRQIAGAVGKLKRTFPQLHVWTLGAYVDYAANAARVRRDVLLVSTLGSLLVAGVIWFYFRRVGTLFICMLPPAVGLGMALGIAGIFHLHLPLMVLAFAGLILGATTDYGIQILAQYGRLADESPPRSDAGSHGTPPKTQAARALFGPITMSVLTSIAGYAALAFSDAPGLRAMGLFIAAGTFCIWLVTFLILPVFIGEYCRPHPTSPRFQFPKKLRWLPATAFTIATIILAIHAAKLNYNSHPSNLNGVPRREAQIQNRFFQIWGNSSHHGAVVIRSHQAESALQQAALLSDNLNALRREHLIEGFVSPTPMLPPTRIFDRRLKRWRAYWSPARLNMLRTRLQQAMAAFGFNYNRSMLSEFVKLPTDASARYRMIHSPVRLFPGGVTITRRHYLLSTTVYPNRRLTPRMASDWVGQIELQFPHAMIIDGSALLFDATQRCKAQLEFLFPWIFLAIFLPVCIYFRRIDIAAIATLSLIVGFIWLAGVAQWFGGGLNFLALVPMLFTMGVAIDYGIYTASDPNLADPAARPRTTTTGICALTTILGSGAIVAAGHPALHWIGLTLVAGITGGYLTALCWIAPLMRLRYGLRQPGKVLLRRLAIRRFALRLIFWGIGIAGAAGALALVIVCVGQLVMTGERPTGTVHLPTHRVVQQLSAHSWHIGRAWMRRVGGIWVISVAGSSGRIGYDDGALGAPIDTQIENDMLDQLHHFVPSLWAQWVITRGVALDMLQLPGYIPGYIQREAYAESVSHPDIHGYLGPTYARLLSYEALDDISQNLIDNPLIDAHAVGCTGVISCPAWSGDHCLWLARNFDFEGGPAFNRQKSITLMRPKKGYAFVSVAWPGLSGCVTGFNSRKIGLFINAAATRGFKPIGEPTIIAARQVLQFAGSLSQAEAIIRYAPVFVADSIVVGDGNTGRAVIIEKSPLHCAVIPVKTYAAVANEFTAPIFQRDPVNRQRIVASTTRFRQARAALLIHDMHGHVNAVHLAALLRDKAGLHGQFIGYGNRNAIDALITAHSAIMNLTKGELWVAAWPYAEGAYLGINVYPLLSRHPPPLKACLLPPIPADHFLTSGKYRQFQTARRALHAGYRYLRQGEFNNALQEAAVANKNDPDFFSSYELKGRADLALGHLRQAAAALSRALALDPPYQARRIALRRLLLLAKSTHTQPVQ
jgi:predicted exporter